MSSLPLPLDAPAEAPLAERLRPRTLAEVIGQAHLLGPGKPLARGVRVGPAALDDPVGAAGRRQDDAGAADGRCLRRAVHRHLGRARRREGHPRGGRARAGRAGRRAAARSSSSTRCTASTRRSRTPSCRTSSRACSPSSARPPRTRRSRSTRRCCRAPAVHVLQALGDDELRAVLARGRGLLQAPPLSDAAAQRLIGYADGDARRLLNTLETVARAVGATSRIDERRWSAGHRREHAGACAGRAAAPLRQGRRAVLRHHLGAAQGGARLRPGRRAVLVRAHARRRRRPALRRAPAACAWRARTSAWPTRARCAWRSTRARPTSAWARPKANSRWRRRWSTWPWRPRAMRSTPPTRRRAPSSRRTARRPCRCTCAMRRRG